MFRKCYIEKCKHKGTVEVKLEAGKTHLCGGHYRLFKKLEQFTSPDKKIAELEKTYNFTPKLTPKL